MHPHNIIAALKLLDLYPEDTSLDWTLDTLHYGLAVASGSDEWQAECDRYAKVKDMLDALGLIESVDRMDNASEEGGFEQLNLGKTDAKRFAISSPYGYAAWRRGNDEQEAPDDEARRIAVNLGNAFVEAGVPSGYAILTALGEKPRSQQVVQPVADGTAPKLTVLDGGDAA